jgi:hypothetical protein
MPIANKILGANVFLYYDGDLIGCAKSMTVNATRKELDVTCSDSGENEQAVVGKAKYTWDIDILWRQASGNDIGVNVTAYDLVKDFQAGTEVTIIDKNSTLSAGEEVYTGVGFLTSFKKSAVVDSVESFTCSGFFNTFTATKQTTP